MRSFLVTKRAHYTFFFIPKIDFFSQKGEKINEEEVKHTFQDKSNKSNKREQHTDTRTQR